jgi:membrane-associated phospholipid phosphatase
MRGATGSKVWGRPVLGLLLIFLLGQGTASSLFAEEASASETDSPPDDAKAEKPYWRQNLFRRFFSDQKYLFTDWWPSEFKRYQFTGPLLAGIALAAAPGRGSEEGPDLEVETYVQNESAESGNSVARGFSTLGNAGPALVLIGAGYLFGRAGHNDRLAEASSLSAEALLSSGLYCTFLKKVTARTRPANGSDGRFFAYHPQQGEVVGSFPSGHATGAFTVATVFAETYKDKKWVPWVTYGTAGLIGLSRMQLGRHFAGDVIIGGLLGHSIGRMVTARQRDSREARFEIQPYFDPAGAEAGVVWTRRW